MRIREPRGENVEESGQRNEKEHSRMYINSS